MSRESKILNVRPRNVQITVTQYESFGWELLSLNGGQISMSRETQNPKYTTLVKYEHQYELIKQKLASLNMPCPYPPVNYAVCIVLFFLFLFPLALYIMHKNKQKNEYNMMLSGYYSKVANLNTEMEEVCNVSRAEFFSKL